MPARLRGTGRTSSHSRANDCADASAVSMSKDSEIIVGAVSIPPVPRCAACPTRVPKRVAYARPSEVANHITVFAHAHVARILNHFGKGLNLCQAIFARVLRVALYRQRSSFSRSTWGSDHVLTVVGKLFERHDRGIGKRGSQTCSA